HQRGSADRGSAAAERADAVLDDGGVAMHDIDVIDIDSEFIGHYLREGRLLTLSVRRHSSQHRDLAVGFHSDGRALPSSSLELRRQKGRRTDPANLDVRGDADSDV